MQIYLLIEDDRQGPFTPEEIAEKIKAGECTSETLAWKDGMEEWQPLRDVLPQSESAQPPPVATPPLPQSLPSSPVPVPPALQNVGDAFSRFIEGFKGLPGRIGGSPKPQPLKWYDRFPVVFGALALFWPLGVVCVWLTKRFENADKWRLSLVGLAWGFLLHLNTSPTNVKDPNGFKEVHQKHLTTAQIEKIKTTPYYRGQEGIPKETRAAIFAETRDRRLKAAEESLNSGNALAAIKYLSFYTDVLPDKESQDLYERIRKARLEEATARLQKADDSGMGNDPQLVPLLEELDFLVAPSMSYRERLEKLQNQKHSSNADELYAIQAGSPYCADEEGKQVFNAKTDIAVKALKKQVGLWHVEAQGDYDGLRMRSFWVHPSALLGSDNAIGSRIITGCWVFDGKEGTTVERADVATIGDLVEGLMKGLVTLETAKQCVFMPTAQQGESIKTVEQYIIYQAVLGRRYGTNITAEFALPRGKNDETGFQERPLRITKVEEFVTAAGLVRLIPVAEIAPDFEGKSYSQTPPKKTTTIQMSREELGF